MNSPPLRSFATRLAMTYVGAAIVLVFLIGCASTLFMFDLYAKTSNEVIASETRAVQRWLVSDRGRSVP